MNLGEISGKVYDRLGYSQTPDSAVVRRIRGYINDTHRTIVSKRSMAKLRRKILSFNSIANNALATLPQAVIGIAVIADRTNKRNLDLITLTDVRYRDPGQTLISSIPDSYMVVNFAAPVAQEPTASAALFAISDAAGDGSGISVNVEGVTAGGYYRKASVAMNGLTAVAMDASITDWITISKFYLSGGATGNVTLRMTSGVGTELGRIPPGHTFSRYTQIMFSPVPSSIITYYVDCEIHLEDMSGPKDEPLLPEDYHDILICGALVREYTKREKTYLLSQEKTVYKDRMGDLTAFLRKSQGVSRGGQRGNGGPQWSQLGPMFSAGS